VIDVRLNNTSHLAGFTKKQDLAYFLRAIGRIDYVHRPDWAPTAGILDDYKNKTIGWDEYERRFCALIRDRRIEQSVDAGLLDTACLLCSEPKPDRCHRRLVAEYLQKFFAGLTVCHL
jgi:uncharacterized protein (DUF488 family)